MYAAPIVSAAMFTASAQAYGAISTTALGTYLWNNPDVGLDAYNLGSDIYNKNWGNISTDILAFAYNGANYGSNYRTGKAANTQLEPTETQRNYNAVMAGRGSQAGASEVTASTRRMSGTFEELRKANVSDKHHIIQDAAVRDLPGYNRNLAPAVQLDGPSWKAGSPHYETRVVQRQLGGGTYAAERRIGYKSLRRAGVPEEEARSLIQQADDYFGNLGVKPNTKTNIPGDRR